MTWKVHSDDMGKLKECEIALTKLVNTMPHNKNLHSFLQMHSLDEVFPGKSLVLRNDEGKEVRVLLQVKRPIHYVCRTKALSIYTDLIDRKIVLDIGNGTASMMKESSKVLRDAAKEQNSSTAKKENSAASVSPSHKQLLDSPA